VLDIINKKYPDPYKRFDDGQQNILNTEATILSGLEKVGKNQNVDSMVRDMAKGIKSSILKRNEAIQVAQNQASNVGHTNLITSTSYKLPEKYVGTYRNIDPYKLDNKESVKVTRESRDIMAYQGAEYIQYMYRLSGEYFRNELLNQKVVSKTGFGNEVLGIYRVVLYADLSNPEYGVYVKEMNKIYMSTGFQPFAPNGVEQYKQIPFYYLVMIHRPADETRENVLNIYIKFMEDLNQEYELDIQPMVSAMPNTSDRAFSPENAGSDFWTLKYIDKGFADLSAKIAIRSYVDMFPMLDADQLESLWNREQDEPSFVYEEECEDVGRSMNDILKVSVKNYTTNKVDALKNLSDAELRKVFTGSSIASCNMLNPKECALPLALWIRDIFDASAMFATSMITKNVVLYFLMHLDANVKNRLKEDSKTIFSKEPGKEMFPADPTVAAVAFNVVIANCLSKHRKQMEWTSKSFESSKHPSPWAVLIEKANDVHGPRYAFPNYSGMRDMICALDLVLMSFIGGYISAAMDTQLGSKFRKIRVAMLRMTYSDDEKKQFFANANMHSFVEKLEDFKSGLTAIQETTLEQAENATYGSSEKQKTHQSLNQPPASNAIRDLSESEEILIAEMIHYSPIKGHWENALATLQSLADAMFVKLSERGFYGGPAIGADEPATRIRTMPNYFKSEHETLNHEIIVEANYDVFQA
jgi:hypothetical protein